VYPFFVRGPHRQSGFTIVELAVVLAIVGILAVMASGVGDDDRANTSGYADQFSAQLDETRMKAQSSRRWIRVLLRADGASADIEQSVSTGMGVPAAFEKIGGFNAAKRVRWASYNPIPLNGPGNSVTEGAGLAAEILFRPDGTTNGGTVFLADPGNENLVRIVIFPATAFARIYKGW
jgi:prepilin-type N-terminal cleavage/methylation domain-containing protein